MAVPKESRTPANENKRKASETDEFTLAGKIHGTNRLQGNDQRSNRNQRLAQAEATGKTDGVIESFEKLDKTVRAERARKKKPSD